MLIPLITVGLAGVIASAWDIRSRTIPNWICVGLSLFGLVWHSVVGGWPGFGSSILGLLAGFGVFLIFYLLGGMGGGDIKLMAGMGAVLCTPGILEAAVWTALLGAGLALGVRYLAYVRKMRIVAIPYAPCIAAGALITAGGRFLL